MDRREPALQRSMSASATNEMFRKRQYRLPGISDLPDSGPGNARASGPDVDLLLYDLTLKGRAERAARPSCRPQRTAVPGTTRYDSTHRVAATLHERRRPPTPGSPIRVIDGAAVDVFIASVAPQLSNSVS